MTLTSTATRKVRRDGWTPARRTGYLDHLALDGNVLAACAHVGLTRRAAYCLRQRDPAFAQAWAAAQAQAREARSQEVGTAAIDGIEHEVWYRGKRVGTRRRYDTRLLLAHIARLDRLIEANPQAVADAERFDELLAHFAGAAGADSDFASRTVSDLYTSADTERFDELLAGQHGAAGTDPDFALRTVSDLYTSPADAAR